LKGNFIERNFGKRVLELKTVAFSAKKVKNETTVFLNEALFRFQKPTSLPAAKADGNENIKTGLFLNPKGNTQQAFNGKYSIGKEKVKSAQS